MTVGDEDVLFYEEAVQRSSCFQDAAIPLLRAGRVFWFIQPASRHSDYAPRAGMENHVNADTLTGRLL